MREFRSCSQVLVAILTVLLLSSLMASSKMTLGSGGLSGPRTNALEIKIFKNATLEAAALEAREIDLIDFPLVAQQIARWSVPPFNYTISIDPVPRSSNAYAHLRTWNALNCDKYGVVNWWNIYSMYLKYPMPPFPPLIWGWGHDVSSLNIIDASWSQDWIVLSEIFDTMLNFNPWNTGIYPMPWLANSFDVSTWTNPDTGLEASKIIFKLNSGINWIQPLDGAILAPLTPEDVRFTAQYVYDHIGWNYPLVGDLYKNADGSLKIEINGQTITFYEGTIVPTALQMLGSLPIIPKLVYESIADPHGFTPGNLPIEKTLIGSGPFYYSTYTPNVGFYLPANRGYFMSIVPDIDTDSVHIHTHWGIYAANVKTGDWVVNVLDIIIVATKLGWHGNPGDVPSDINKDGVVNLLDLILVATNLGANW